MESAFELVCGYLQHLLSRGLVYLAVIATVEIYDKRHQVLYEPYLKRSPDGFFFEGLRLSHGPQDGVELSEHNEDEEEHLARLHPLIVYD